MVRSGKRQQRGEIRGWKITTQFRNRRAREEASTDPPTRQSDGEGQGETFRDIRPSAKTLVHPADIFPRTEEVCRER